MTLQTDQKQEKPTCAYCGKQVYGREGKKYCNVDCKNNYNSRIRSQLREWENQIFPPVFAKIKTNYRILQAYNLAEQDKDKKIHILLDDLKKLGFDPNFCTSAYTDQYRTLYKCCFDYYWEQQGNWITLGYNPYAYQK